ncbi:MAG TPA: hypothetical protein VMX17_11680 [Candidatus Glassbacteria bacterium]|nr:hypothetical protein [Candidatus Glassbacteria bacterium]
MRILSYNDTAQSKRRYLITIDDIDMMDVNFTDFDRSILKDCEKSNSIADKILALELIARRIEESQKKDSPCNAHT